MHTNKIITFIFAFWPTFWEISPMCVRLFLNENSQIRLLNSQMNIIQVTFKCAIAHSRLNSGTHLHVSLNYGFFLRHIHDCVRATILPNKMLLYSSPCITHRQVVEGYSEKHALRIGDCCRTKHYKIKLYITEWRPCNRFLFHGFSLYNYKCSLPEGQRTHSTTINS